MANGKIHTIEFIVLQLFESLIIQRSRRTKNTLNEVQEPIFQREAILIAWQYLGLIVRKPAFCICENKDADQLRGNREADQRLCFRYIDSTIPLLPTYEISSL